MADSFAAEHWWPEAPDNASWFPATSSHSGFWFVFGLPPEPFPHDPPSGTYDRATYGPGGTVYSFTADQMVERLAGFEHNPGKRLVYWLRKLGTKFVDGTGSWSVPFAWSDPALPVEVQQMRIIRATIHAKLGTVEEVAHVLHFRTNPADVDQSPEALDVFGEQLAGQFTAFWNQHGLVQGLDTVVHQLFPTTLKYDEIRLAYIEVTGGQKPRYLINTRYVPITSNPVGNGSEIGLPWEVACAVTMKTAQRGPRFRGRTYLGPFTTGMLDGGNPGLFKREAVQLLGNAWGIHVVNGTNTATGNRLHIASYKYGTSEGVNKVEMGLVPDSQRRRRKSQLEVKQIAWDATAPPA